jgi:hypothetical protein
MLTVTAQPGVTRYGQQGLMGMVLVAAGLFGFFFAGVRPKRRLFSLVIGTFAGLLIAGTLLASVGCGSNNNMANLGTGSIVVTATSGALVHTTTVNLTVHQ